MATHAKDALRRPRITQVLNLPLTVPTSEAAGAEGLVAGEDGEILDLVAASIAAVGAVVANKGPIAEEEEVCIRVEKRSTCITAEAVGFQLLSRQYAFRMRWGYLIITHQAQKLCLLPVSATYRS
jgi:hypothetical protein